MKLLTPISLGPVTLKNRVVSTAHAAFTDFYRPDSSGERYMAYQERRARGGTGLIITTAMHVHRASQMVNHWVFSAEHMAPKFRQISERVHRYGTKIFVQLFHFGVQGKSDSHDDLTPLWGFSPLTSVDGEACHVMTDAEIEEVIEAFVAAARCAVENGIDGIELHATHGYLIQQSFMPFANRRTDKWGQRLYFARELSRRVRAAIGRDKALGFRITLDDYRGRANGGLDTADLIEIAADLCETGLFDYVNTSEGNGNMDYSRVIGSFRHPFGKTLPNTRALRERIQARIPIIGVNKIPTVDLAERALEEGCCDLVGMTRAQIADPDLVQKIAAGQLARIRPCTGSNQGCIDRVGLYPITCFHNPEVGEENRLAELAKRPVEPKRVLVIGGGPAGMKAAEIAARRGHTVTLAESGTRLGGRLTLVENLGPSSNLLAATSWLEQELALLSVDIRLQTTVDEAFLRAHAPDAIVLATGATPSPDLAIPNDGSIPVLDIDAAVEARFEGQTFDMTGTRALLVDLRATYETALCVEALVNRGAKVTVATPYLTWGANLGFTHLADYLGLLPKWGVRTMPQTRCTRIENGEAVLEDGRTAETVRAPFDFIVAGVVGVPRDELADLCRSFAPTTLVGDVVAPRSALEAFREGDRIGRLL
ncbi:FAD-dependent oxidoreductase [Pedomonas sp. V897]|uniref:oxidoreductase n=1 Tax=Pedomonas sp. V897 TaxID=3446482 RepID=UPI003EE0F86C